MGNRISISQPAVIHTELRPLDESFWIGANGQLEQWYNENDNVFAPDRTVTPLTLSPHLSVKDGDTGNGYSTESSPSTLTFQYVTWKVKEWDGTEYVETTITSTTNTDPYYKSGNNLVVQKNNYDPTHAITITCEVRYNDPRDVGAMNDTQGSTMLVTSVDATAVYPVIDIANPSARSFNPLRDDPIYEFDASADFPTTSVGDKGAQCPVDPMGTEEVVMGTNSIAPTLTIQYGDGIGSTTQQNQTFVRRQTSGGAVSSIHGDVSFIKNIKGNAVAWNQLVEDSYIHYQGTLSPNDIYVMNGIGYIDGHKYYAFCSFPSGMTYGAYFQTEGEIGFGYLDPNSNRGIFTNTGTYVGAPYIGNVGSEDITFDVYTQIIDLTLIFGAGNEPSTVEAFETWLANNIGSADHYPYNAGELLPCKLTGIKTVGFNALNINGRTARTDYSDFGDHDDPHPFSESEYLVGFTMDDYINPENVTIYSVNDNTITTNGGGGYGLGFPIKVLPNTSYYFQRTDTQGESVPRVGFYDSGCKSISYSQDFLFTTPSNCCWAVIVICPEGGGTVTVQDLCINISNSSKNGTYEPYKTFSRNLDVTKLYGKNSQGNYVQMFPNGMRSAGSVHDVVDLENATATVYIGSRVYSSGDESDSTVITDMTNTFYQLATPLQYTDVVYRSGGADTPVSKLFGSFEWYGVNSSGQEVPIDTLPIYTNAPQPTNGGQHTESIRINALYGKEIPVFLRVKRHPWDASVLPPKVTKSVAWKIPPIDVVVVSDKGSAVRSTHIPVGQTAEDFTFSTIVNQQGDVISDAKKADNMVFKWYYVKYATNGQAIIPTGETSPEVYVGSGQTQTISAATLKNTKPVGGESTSTSVFCEAYLLGAYHLVNGQWVRTIDE